MLSVPLPSMPDDTGALPAGLFWPSTDHSTGGSPISRNHGIMNDQALQGDVNVQAGNFAGGNTHVYVGTLVLIALAGIILIHMGGFRAMTDVNIGRR